MITSHNILLDDTYDSELNKNLIASANQIGWAILCVSFLIVAIFTFIIKLRKGSPIHSKAGKVFRKLVAIENEKKIRDMLNSLANKFIDGKYMNISEDVKATEIWDKQAIEFVLKQLLRLNLDEKYNLEEFT